MLLSTDLEDPSSRAVFQVRKSPEVRHLPHGIIPQHARHAESRADDRQWGSPSHFELIRMANETDSKAKTMVII